MSGTSGSGLSYMNNALPYSEYSKTILPAPYVSSLDGNTNRYESVLQGGRRRLSKKRTSRRSRKNKGGKYTKQKKGGNRTKTRSGRR